MSYTLFIKKSAAKEMDALPSKILSQITKAIMTLCDNPRPKGCKKLKGSAVNLWRIRIGDYRVI